MTLISDSKINATTTIQAHANGAYEHLRRKGRLMFRVDLKNTVTQIVRDQKSFGEQSVQTISDGKYAYTLSTSAGQPPSATRATPKPGQTVLADEAFFDSLERDFVLKVLPEETINSIPVWVLEAVPRPRSSGKVAKAVYYLTKDSGIRIRSTNHDRAGKRIQLTELTDIKLDPPLNPDRFVFKAPPGVPVVDLSPPR
jgi:outer membrane lipoprotein-sorting protein